MWYEVASLKSSNGTWWVSHKVDESHQCWHRCPGLTLWKIAIWMSKNCSKLDNFSKKLPKIFIFSKKLPFWKMSCFWQFFDIQMSIFWRVRSWSCEQWTVQVDVNLLAVSLSRLSCHWKPTVPAILNVLPSACHTPCWYFLPAFS